MRHGPAGSNQAIWQGQIRVVGRVKSDQLTGQHSPEWRCARGPPCKPLTRLLTAPTDVPSLADLLPVGYRPKT